MASETLGAPVRLLRYHQADGREPMWSQLISRSVYRRPTTLGKKNQEKRLEHAKAVKFDVYWSGGKAVRGGGKRQMSLFKQHVRNAHQPN